MTFGKAVVAVLALVAVFALGVWTGPYLTDDRLAMGQKGRAAQTARQADDERADKARPARARAARPAAESEVTGLPASDPQVQKRLKPVLNTGTNMDKA